MEKIDIQGNATFEASLSLIVERANGTIEDLGIVSRKLVTTAWANLLVDVLQSSDAAFSDFRYHDFGTGTTAAVAGNVGLKTPTGEAREEGTQTEGAAANIYVTMAVHNFASVFAITEHGVFNAASGVTLLDRSVFDAIEVGIGDRIRATYSLTVNAGG